MEDETERITSEDLRSTLMGMLTYRQHVKTTKVTDNEIISAFTHSFPLWREIHNSKITICVDTQAHTLQWLKQHEADKPPFFCIMLKTLIKREGAGPSPDTLMLTSLPFRPTPESDDPYSCSVTSSEIIQLLPFYINNVIWKRMRHRAFV